MSALSSTGLGAGLPVSASAPIDPATEPASIRDGNQAAKNAYQTGLAFEDILVNQLAQAMTATVPGLDGSSDGSDPSDSSDPSGGSAASGSGAGIGAYASLLPQALSSGVMSSGGTGIAMEIARALDPALAGPPASSAGPPASSGGATPQSSSGTAPR